MPERFRTPALIALALLIELALAGLLRTSGRAPAAEFAYLAHDLLWFTAAATFYLIASALVLRPSAARARSELRIILLAAVVFRLTLLPLAPTLSQDLWRTHWDGQIQHDGFNPYQYAPQSALFNPIRIPADRAVPDPAQPAARLPLAELLARWSYDLSVHLRAEKLLFDLCDILLLLLLVRMLRRRDLPPQFVLLYAWSPLALLEVAGNGHAEPAAALFALLALHWAGRRPRWSGVAIASAALTQWFAVALVPVVLAARPRKWWATVGAMLAWGALLVLPYAWINKHLALATVAADLRGHFSALPFNASLFALARAWFGPRAALLVSAALIAAAIVSALARRLAPLRAAFLILGAILIAAPQVHPWYLLWILPLVVFWPDLAWIYFSLAVVLAYLLPLHPALIWVEYVPLFALLAWQGWPALTPSAPGLEPDARPTPARAEPL